MVGKMPSKPFRIPFIGIEIERKTDLLAAVAFILAFSSAFAQFTYFLRGAKVKLFAPDLAMLILAENPGNGERYLRIAARMAYANTGWRGYNDIVHREEVELSFGDEHYRQLWQSEQHITAANGELLQKYLNEAGPFPTVAGSSVSREVYFAPVPERCDDGISPCEEEYRQFISANRAMVLIRNHQKMKLTFKSYLLRQQDPLTSECEIDIGEDVAFTLLRNEWMSMRCFGPSEEK